LGALLQLVSSLHGLSANNIQVKINKYLMELTGAETAFIVPIERQERDSVFIQVIGTNIEALRAVPAEKVLQQQLIGCEVVHYHQLEQKNKEELQSLLKCDLSSFVSVPIADPATTKPRKTSSLFKEPLNSQSSSPLVNGCPEPHSKAESQPEGPTAAILACLVNKREGGHFSDRDVKVVRECFQVCIGPLLNTFVLEEELSLKLQLQKLLTVAKNLFAHLGDVTVLLRQIMSEARQLTQAERCSLFLVDAKQQELVAKVFDGNMLPDGTVEQQEVRLPLGTGIAGHVATTGRLLNIKDAYNHHLFYRGCDDETGFKTRNILCFPIINDEGVIGVAELCNKQTNTHFTKFDEEMAMAFSSYCGLAIIHSLMYKKVADAQYRSKLSNELMMYHMKVPEDEVTSLVTRSEVNSFGPMTNKWNDFASFKFTPRSIPLYESIAATFYIFEELGMLQRWRVSRESLARFLLMVKRGYRDPPYHNWTHAFSVAHFSFLLLRNLKLLEKGLITDLEAFALVIACLCHDTDHRGTNNTFQISSNSVLAALYSSEGSVMERHHFAQSMCILNTEGCNILDNLSKSDYTRCLDLIRDNILATDLAHHIRIFPEIQAMAETGVLSSSPSHHYLLNCLLMTASDLSDQTKDWLNSKKVSELVYTEFFSQGDLEKAMGNKPVEMMDREKACIPSLQIPFYNDIVIPVFRCLSLIDSGAEEPYNATLLNKEYWKVMGDILEKRDRKIMKNDVMAIFKDELLDQEVLRHVISPS